MDVTLTAPLGSPGRAGPAGRLTFRALLTSGLAADMVDEAAPAASSASPVQILCLEADQLARALPAWTQHVPSDSYRILIPHCGPAGFPAASLPMLAEVHEIWAPSRSIQLSLAGRTACPVIFMPPTIELDATVAVSRQRLGIAEGRFTFLYPFDPLALFDHDDPRGAIRAFRQAFPRGGEACLILASNDAGLGPSQRDVLDQAIGDDPDILFVDERFRRADLMASCDAIVSLPRSLGTGLAIAEAMLLRKPVIATRYFASPDLVSDRNGFPVDYRLIRSGNREDTGDTLAQPDVAQAAWIMRRLRSEPGLAEPAVTRAYLDVCRDYSRQSVAAMQRQRFDVLGLPPR